MTELHTQDEQLSSTEPLQSHEIKRTPAIIAGLNRLCAEIGSLGEYICYIFVFLLKKSYNKNQTVVLGETNQKSGITELFSQKKSE